MRRLVIGLIVLSGIFLCSTVEVQAGPYYEAYAEAWGLGWGDWSWGCSPVPTTTRAFKGSKSMRVTYNSAWAGFGLGSGQNFNTAGYRHLVFALYNEQAGNNLWVYMQRASDGVTAYLQVANYTETLQIPGGKWIWVRIPVADFGLGNAPVISDFGFQSGNANSIVYYDEVAFAASVTFYEGIQQEKGPGAMLWSWNVAVSQIVDSGDWWLMVTPNSPWGGIQLQQQAIGIVSSDYGGLTLMFQQGSSSQRIYVSLINNNNQAVGTVVIDQTYLPDTLRPLQAHKWYRVVIPLSHFFSGTANIRGVAIESDQASTFFIDDVRLIQKLLWPRMDGAHVVNYPGNGGSFGDHWENKYCTEAGLTNKKLLHSGTDYSAPAGTDIRAAARGFVKYVGTAGTGWGQAIVVEHEDGLTTMYLHTDPSAGITQGVEVQRGQKIGDTSAISGAHLHFGIRAFDYEPPKSPDWIEYSRRGRLPEVKCKTEASPTYQEKAFPYFYLNSEMLDW
jgi:hypothetical protein